MKRRLLQLAVTFCLAGLVMMAVIIKWPSWLEIVVSTILFFTFLAGFLSPASLAGS